MSKVLGLLFAFHSLQVELPSDGCATPAVGVVPLSGWGCINASKVVDHYANRRRP